jgi:hypothetical protein
MPQSLIPLLGQDIFHKLGAALHIPPLNSTTIFLLQQIPAAPPLLKPPDFLSPLIPEFQIDSWVSDTQHPQVAHHHKPLLITLKDPTIFDTIPQYPLHPSTLPGLKSIISQLLQAQLLILICSPHNTPIVGVKKPNSDYRLVQDLRNINEAVLPTYPMVPNPYTLLSTIPATIQFFTVLDLKDALLSPYTLHPNFCSPLPGQTLTPFSPNCSCGLFCPRDSGTTPTISARL